MRHNYTQFWFLFCFFTTTFSYYSLKSQIILLWDFTKSLCGLLQIPTTATLLRLSVKLYTSTMVSLRRRRLLGLCSGRSYVLTPLPLFCDNEKPDSVHPMPSKDRNLRDGSAGAKKEPPSSTAHGSSLANEQPQKYVPGPPIKRRKRHRRKHIHNQEPCLMRGVYFKNMKWQAAIKVDKKQIHLGTVGSQEEAAHLYDRAAFMCGREPNFELPEEEKQELMKFKWEEFLAVTRHSINNKKLKKWQWSASEKRSETRPLQDGDWEDKQDVNGLSTSEDGEEDRRVS